MDEGLASLLRACRRRGRRQAQGRQRSRRLLRREREVTFIERFERATEGKTFLSVGVYPPEPCRPCAGSGVLGDDSCDHCSGRGTSCDCPTCEDSDPENSEGGGFSWSSCDTCDSRLGGDRYAAHYRDDTRAVHHLDVCTDCLMFIANGDLPDGEDA